MTTTERSLSQPREIVDEYVRQGFHGIFFRPLSPYGFAVRTKQIEKYDTERWLSFYREGLAYIIELNSRGYVFQEFYTALILRKLLTPYGSGYVDLQSPAGVGIAAVVYNYDSYEDIFGNEHLLDVLDATYADSVRVYLP